MDKHISIQTYIESIKRIVLPDNDVHEVGPKPSRDWLILLIIGVCIAVFFVFKGLALFTEIQSRQHDVQSQGNVAHTEQYEQMLTSILSDIHKQQAEFEALKATSSVISDPSK